MLDADVVDFIFPLELTRKMQEGVKKHFVRREHGDLHPDLQFFWNAKKSAENRGQKCQLFGALKVKEFPYFSPLQLCTSQQTCAFCVLVFKWRWYYAQIVSLAFWIVG